MIKVRNLSKSYQTRLGQNQVLDHVSFDLRKGEKLGILGRNGAGKSTLIRLVSGAEMPTAGTIEREMSVSWPLAFGGAFQPMLTGRDNVRFISRIYNQDFPHNMAFVEEFSEIGSYLNEPVRTYSSGMRARLAFAISMIIEFECFLIDEVGAVGDARFHERCNYELFIKRADRAMVIISHDAAYLRDHCSRFAILHDRTLRLVDDFDEAYAEFRTLVGLTPREIAPVRVAMDRTRMIEAMQTRAQVDERFLAHVQDGDLHRNARRWKEAKGGYAAALELYPWQRSYWVQHGHVAKEDGLFATAEISYRTAIALGEPGADVKPHLIHVMQRQDLPGELWSIPEYTSGRASQQPPGACDVGLFAKLCWQDDQVDEQTMLNLLRTCSSCDALLAAMIGDDRFLGKQAGWLAMDNQMLPAAESSIAEDGIEIPQWASSLASIACPAGDGHNPESVARTLCRLENPWPFMAKTGFADWPLVQAAVALHRQAYTSVN